MSSTNKPGHISGGYAAYRPQDKAGLSSIRDLQLAVRHATHSDDPREAQAGLERLHDLPRFAQALVNGAVPGDVGFNEARLRATLAGASVLKRPELQHARQQAQEILDNYRNRVTLPPPPPAPPSDAGSTGSTVVPDTGGYYGTTRWEPVRKQSASPQYIARPQTKLPLATPQPQRPRESQELVQRASFLDDASPSVDRPPPKPPKEPMTARQKLDERMERLGIVRRVAYERRMAYIAPPAPPVPSFPSSPPPGVVAQPSVPKRPPVQSKPLPVRVQAPTIQVDSAATSVRTTHQSPVDTGLTGGLFVPTQPQDKVTLTPPRPLARANARRGNRNVADGVLKRRGLAPAAETVTPAIAEAAAGPAQASHSSAESSPKMGFRLEFGDNFYTEFTQPGLLRDMPEWSVRKIDPRRTAHLNLGYVKDSKGDIVPLRFSRVETDDGPLLMTNGLYKGAAGVVHFGINAAGDIVAVKKFRLEGKGRDEANKLIASKTDVTGLGEFQEETDLQAKFQDVQTGVRNNKAYAVSRIGRDLDVALTSFTGDRHVAATWFMTQLADSIKKVHDQGYIHLDVKMPNALADDAANVVIADFGLTRPFDFDAREPIGTPGYMAPEVVRGGKLTAKADTWSLGATIIDVHVPWHASPFVNATPADFAEYKLWHEALAGPDGGVDINQIKRPGEPGENKWDHFFHKLSTQDPSLCAFILERMMHPEAEKRADMAEVSAWAKTRLPAPQSPEADAMRAAWSEVVKKDANRNTAIAGLQRMAALIKSGEFVV